MTDARLTDSFGSALADVVAGLPTDLPMACSPAVAARVAGAERAVDTTPLDQLVAGTVSSVLLVDDEVSRSGDRAEEFISRATDGVRPAGMLVLSALAGDPEEGGPRHRLADRVSPALRPANRVFDATGIEHLLMHRGLTVQRLEKHIAEDGTARFLVVGRAPVSTQERSARFIASLPFKLVTAAVLCQDDAGRMLLVFDSFRRHWTIPGGVVDAGEDPRAGAVREAVEEGGVRVQAGPLLGVFNTAIPDRLLMVYAAAPLDPGDPTTGRPITRQPHEIGEVRWVLVGQALEMLNPRTRWQVQQCLDRPGETWRE
ncbi:MAG TPA: NUDIX hydrolase [Frankiaceae bacterium]|nr:NUDIX hydrolase [Frankiaceae bacterium]